MPYFWYIFSLKYIQRVVLDFVFQNSKHRGYGPSTATSHCVYKLLKELISTRSAERKENVCIRGERLQVGFNSRFFRTSIKVNVITLASALMCMSWSICIYTKCKPGTSFMKYLRFQLKILWYGIRVNFPLKKELKPKFLLSSFMKLAPCG